MNETRIGEMIKNISTHFRLENRDRRQKGPRKTALAIPATRRGVVSTKQGKDCLGTPKSQGKPKVLAKITSQREPKGLRLKKI